MKILVLHHDYPVFLDWLYQQYPGLDDEPYDEQRRVRAESLFGTAYFYPEALERRGHEAVGVYVNNGQMQRAWARKHGYDDRDESEAAEHSLLDGFKSAVADTAVGKFAPALRSLFGDRFVSPSWFYEILERQFEHYDPDVVLSLSVDGVSSEFIAEAKSRYGFLAVGQIAAPIPDWVNPSHYDLMTSALPQFVERFEARGIPSRQIHLGFEPRLLDHIDPSGTDVSVSFVGSLSAHHESRVELLERLATEVPLQVWAPSPDQIPNGSPLASCYQGPAWGAQMYEVLARSDIVLNSHIDAAGEYAANLRLYEATGAGSFLLTDHKTNMDTLFEVGREVVTYRSPEDCVEKIRRYLDAPEEREKIAAAGHARTVSDHTYDQRAAQLEAFIEPHC